MKSVEAMRRGGPDINIWGSARLAFYIITADSDWVQARSQVPASSTLQLTTSQWPLLKSAHSFPQGNHGMETLVESCLNIQVVEVAGGLEPQNLGLLCLPSPIMHTRYMLHPKILIS